MAKYSVRTPSGRQVVLPFTQKEIDDIRLYCKQQREKASDKKFASKNPHWSDKYQWDRNYMLIDLGVNVALRISDLRLLTVNEQIKKGFIDVHERKTLSKRKNVNRPFELNSRITKEINEYIARHNLQDNEFLFQSREGYNMPLSTHQPYNLLKEVAKNVGIVKKVGTHSLRKTFGYLYYLQTKDLVGLHRMIHSGKGDPNVTLVYISMADNEVSEKRKNFDV